MADIEIITIDLDELDEETRVLFLRCMPDEPIDYWSALTQDVVDEALVVTGLVTVH